jgi:hypothetical protein
VLAQLRLERYIATTGTYVQLDTFNCNRDIDLNESFKQVFKEDKNIVCDVCALGSAFVSLVNIENKCSVNQMKNVSGMFERLAKHFGYDNLALMESAFECISMGRGESSLSDDTLDVAAAWGRRYADDKQRLRAIMLNVIRNNGDFKIPVRMFAGQ